LFLFGFFAFMKPKIKCMTIVNSSVQGLSVGAKVKFSGVPVGEITNIKIARCDFIYIYMDIFTECLMQGDSKHKEIEKAFESYIREQMKKGLRCQLRYEGITGSLYQEIQFFDLKQYPKNKIPEPKQDILYIPSVPPVLFDSIMRRIDVSLNKMSGIDEIFKDVGSALKKVNTYLENPKINDVINNVQAVSNNIHDISISLKNTLTKERIDEITTELSTTMEEIKLVVRNLNEQINKSKLPETSDAARVLMETTVKQLDDAIINFNTTARSVKNLSNELDNNPSALIWGTNKEKVVPSY
jgi:paraquat-inducible protein B